jgi:hypothetical protein
MNLSLTGLLYIDYENIYFLDQHAIISKTLAEGGK